MKGREECAKEGGVYEGEEECVKGRKALGEERGENFTSEWQQTIQ